MSDPRLQSLPRGVKNLHLVRTGLCKTKTGWRRMADGGWRMADDKMRIVKCGWKNADNKMQMTKKLK